MYHYLQRRVLFLGKFDLNWSEMDDMEIIPAR